MNRPNSMYPNNLHGNGETFSVGFPTSRHCLFTNHCHAHWHAIGESRSGHEILARDWSARIISPDTLCTLCTL